MRNKLTVLLLDDEHAMLDLAAIILHRAGYHVRCCHDPSKAIENIWQDPPDIIVMDTALSLVDGYEICRQIRTNRRTEHIPIVVLSNDEQRESWLTAQSAGANAFVPKTRIAKMLTPAIERQLACYSA